MKIKTVWKWTKIIWGLTYIGFVVIFVIVLGFFIAGMLQDKTALIDTVAMSTVTLLLAFASLPNLLIQLLSLLEINQKKTFTATKKCPNCRHTIDLKITED
ncbi:hypothetical protein HUB98_09190 [Paenibacillus barcinonensis]|uniref:Uncharacterized protein n=1 Tax=Paenibacillus barcinonensis TaxID=198119 RepID=A0A2V4VBQ4_PAEBA|nr:MULTISPECIES: hypothetical protein [Paenibacillus]PYE49827.1 hypothetical protein DFQ00_105331 [Paenibacillus barcinonensis]QKS56498.1 hypothetical protein HUB98_09190 [Paenibacillus barcinonensis]